MKKECVSCFVQNAEQICVMGSIALFAATLLRVKLLREIIMEAQTTKQLFLPNFAAFGNSDCCSFGSSDFGSEYDEQWNARN